MASTIVYLDVDDEITSAAARVRSSGGGRVAVVLPYGSRVATSRINFRLLARDAQTSTRWVRQFERAGKALTTRFGFELKLTCYELPAARRLWASRTPAADRIIREAIPLAGATPLAALSSVEG